MNSLAYTVILCALLSGFCHAGAVWDTRIYDRTDYFQLRDPSPAPDLIKWIHGGISRAKAWWKSVTTDFEASPILSWNQKVLVQEKPELKDPALRGWDLERAQKFEELQEELEIRGYLDSKNEYLRGRLEAYFDNYGQHAEVGKSERPMDILPLWITPLIERGSKPLECFQRGLHQAIQELISSKNSTKEKLGQLLDADAVGSVSNQLMGRISGRSLEIVFQDLELRRMVPWCVENSQSSPVTAVHTLFLMSFLLERVGIDSQETLSYFTGCLWISCDQLEIGYDPPVRRQMAEQYQEALKRPFLRREGEILIQMQGDCLVPLKWLREFWKHALLGESMALEPWPNVVRQGIERDLESIAPLGSGASSEVYQAKSKSSGKEVAIKISRFDNELTPEVVTEVGVFNWLRRFPHPNVLSYHDVVFLANRWQIVMEYCPVNLWHVIENYRKNGFSKRRVQFVFRQILMGLAHLHGLGLIHRDIKPDNILLTDGPNGDWQVKIADFGATQQVGLPVERFPHEVVTLFYRAPELLSRATSYGPEIDIWSAGVVLAELVLRERLLPSTSASDAKLTIRRFFHQPNANDLARRKRIQEFLGETGISLLDELLTDREYRITAEQALRHSYFTQRL